MSKAIKQQLEKTYAGRLGNIAGVAVINPKGMTGNANNGLRKQLFEKGMKMLVVKNSLARRAAGSTKLKGFEKLLDGPSALVYTEQAEVTAVARLLVEAKKKDEKLELRGVYFDGEVYEGDKGVEQVSKLPTREEAIANLLASILSPARNLAGAFKGQAGKIAALVKAVEEKKKEAEGVAAPATA